MKQLRLITDKPILKHGGELRLGKRKTKRPLLTKKPIHLVLKASRDFRDQVDWALAQSHHQAAKFGLRIYDFGLGHDHLHLVLTIPDREAYVKFIRAVTGAIARRLGKGIWKLLPFTRIAAWGRAFEALKRYMRQNNMEFFGVVPYQPRKRFSRRDKLGRELRRLSRFPSPPLAGLAPVAEAP